MLDDADDNVRGQAFATLGVIGIEPKELFAASVKILKSKSDKLYPAAAATFRRLGPTATSEVLALLRSIDAKTEEGAGLRLVCLQTLTASGPGAKEAVDDLTNALKDPSPKVRLIAARRSRQPRPRRQERSRCPQDAPERPGAVGQGDREGRRRADRRDAGGRLRGAGGHHGRRSGRPGPRRSFITSSTPSR